MITWVLVTSINTVLSKVEAEQMPTLTTIQAKRGYRWKNIADVPPFFVRQYETWR